MIRAYLFSHALTVIVFAATLVMSVRLSASKRNSQSTIAWLLAFAFVPFVAIPFYLLVGSRKFPRRAKGPSPLGPSAKSSSRKETRIASVLPASEVSPPRVGNSFEFISSGESAYGKLLTLVRGATRSIDVTVFILGDDRTGRGIIDALAERAKSGVSVRVILDAVGSAASLAYAAHVLNAAGGEVRCFMPFMHSPIRGRTNLRSHRKLTIVDGSHVFAGGMNLALEYMGDAPITTEEPRWRDFAAIASGPVAADAAALFESDWIYCGGSRRPSGDAAGPEPRGDEVVQSVQSGPDMNTDTLYDLFLVGIFNARERVAIVTPYYVPDDLLQHALVLSARRGVTTDLVLPSRSNHRLADLARRGLLRELRAAGVRIHFYGKGMVHAKAMVVDQTFAYVGSPNFDMRSLFLNYENALCTYSAGAVAQIRAGIDELISECGTADPVEHTNWLLEQLARMLAPEL